MSVGSVTRDGAQEVETARSQYVLVTACRNESAYIDGLIDAVSRQTQRPLHWIVVDDGSTDDTAERVRCRLAALPFVDLVRLPEATGRSFASQVFAARQGWERLRNVEFDVIGFLDADIRIDPGYYQRLLQEFDQDPSLGVCGGAVVDQHVHYRTYIRAGSEEFHVPGGVQCFRRACFEDIGGYTVIEGGGQDTIADVSAMMHGWKVRVIPELPAIHLRPEGVSNESTFRQGIAWGQKFYLLGYHPVYYLAQCVRRAARQPVVVLFRLMGFAWASFRREPRPVNEDFVRAIRTFQMDRLRRTLLPTWLGDRGPVALRRP